MAALGADSALDRGGVKEGRGGVCSRGNRKCDPPVKMRSLMQSIDKDNIVTKVEPKLRVLTVFFYFITRRAEGDGGLKIAYSVFSAKTRQERKSGSEIERREK